MGRQTNEKTDGKKNRWKNEWSRCTPVGKYRSWLLCNH